MESHIQIPKFLIKNFAAEDGKVFLCTLRDGLILKRPPKSIGVSVDYYDQDVEISLNKEVETRFANTVHNLIKDISNKKAIMLNIAIREIITKFIFINFLRSEKTLIDTNEQLLTKDLSSLNETHNDIVRIGLRHVNYLSLPFDANCVQIEVIINESSVPFISSRHGCCEIPRNNPRRTFFPVSSKIAFLLTILKNPIDADLCIDPWFIEADEVQKLNLLMYEQEREYNNSFLISCSKDPLVNVVKG